MNEAAEVLLWGARIGFVSHAGDAPCAEFAYDPAFRGAGLEPSPLAMPVSGARYSFPSLPWQSFRGLPGMLADSLPDKFGNAVLDGWLEAQGRDPGTLSPIERLCYTGSRGMGALEFRPALFDADDAAEAACAAVYAHGVAGDLASAAAGENAANASDLANFLRL